MIISALFLLLFFLIAWVLWKSVFGGCVGGKRECYGSRYALVEFGQIKGMFKVVAVSESLEDLSDKL